MNKTAVSSTKYTNAITKGINKSLPIAFGYIPIGFAYGVLAQKASISNFNILLMSIIVFAGSSQFIAVGLISTGISPISTIITTFIVNLRHMLMSAATAPHLKTWRKLEIALFTYQITDETFAVHSTEFAKSPPDKKMSYTINMIAQLSWIGGTILGILGGNLISDVKPLGLDFALPGMFIALLVLQIKKPLYAIIASIAGLCSIILKLAGIDQWNVILATILAATIGAVIELWIKD